MGLPLCNGSDVQEAADVMGEGVDFDPRCACGQPDTPLVASGAQIPGSDGRRNGRSCQLRKPASKLPVLVKYEVPKHGGDAHQLRFGINVCRQFLHLTPHVFLEYT